MRKFWMVVNIADRTGEHNGDKIPASQAPRFMHLTQGQAEVELLRLQEKFPHGEFAMLEAIAKAEQKQVYGVVPIDDDKEIPF